MSITNTAYKLAIIALLFIATIAMLMVAKDMVSLVTPDTAAIGSGVMESR